MTITNGLARIAPIAPNAPAATNAGPAQHSRITATVPAPAAHGFADRLHEKTGGVPFVVEEVLRTYLEGPGGLPGRPEALEDLAVPTVLRDVVLQRLFALDDGAREILDAAAVIGLVTDDRLLAEVTRRDAAEIASHVSSALRKLGCTSRKDLAGILSDDAKPPT